MFVVFDDMQYTRRDWRNRNYIKTNQGLKWLTVPVEVKGKYFQKINETIVSEKNWNTNHWQQVKHCYSKAPFFKQLESWVEELYNTATFETITAINVHFLKAICQFLEIKTAFRDSREFDLKEGKTERLVDICKKLGATEYYTGPAAKNYMEEDLFTAENISVNYFSYDGYPEYQQMHSPFEHGVCIWDLIFNMGEKSKNFLVKNI